VKRHVVLCEGPDDISALRAIARKHFIKGTTSTPARPPAAGFERHVKIPVSDALAVELKTVSGKSDLAKNAALIIRDLPPRRDINEPDLIEQIVLVYDPDAQSLEDFEKESVTTLERDASDWVWTAREGIAHAWLGAREDELPIELRMFAWTSTQRTLDGLNDEHNLERLVCQIFSLTYADNKHEEELIVPTLSAIHQRMNKPPMWKSAVHLWCALLGPRWNEVTVCDQAFQQHPQLKKVSEEVLKSLGLFEQLEAVFSSVAVGALGGMKPPTTSP
jgi:hypothetical protein